MKQAGWAITLVGSILEMFVHMYFIYLSGGWWIIGAAVFIPLSWVTRYHAARGHQGWAIYGIIHGFVFCLPSCIGYIFSEIGIVREQIKAKEEQASIEQ